MYSLITLMIIGSGICVLFVIKQCFENRATKKVKG